MKKSIYCIENTVNGMKYVGQSVNPKTRVVSHFWALENNKAENKKFQKDYNLYGRDVYINYILEENVENYDDVEQMYISKNKLEGLAYNKYIIASVPPTLKGENNHNSNITSIQCEQIKSQLKINFKKGFIIEISDKLGVTLDTISKINLGQSWFDKNETYPIQKTRMIDVILSFLKYTKYSQKEIAKMLGVARSTITMINIGKNKRLENENYPIRK